MELGTERVQACTR